MIIRSGLIRNRDEVDFDGFSEHWRVVHGPLALKVSGMHAYAQNHIVERIVSPSEDELHRIDGISQLWFDDVEAMTHAMASDAQRACIEDIRGFLSDVTILIQAEGELTRFGNAAAAQTKLIAMLRGHAEAISAHHAFLVDGLAQTGADGTAIRINPVIDRSFVVDPSVPSGAQIVDAVLEIWLQDTAEPRTFDAVLHGGSAEIDVIAAFRVHEHIFRDR